MNIPKIQEILSTNNRVGPKFQRSLEELQKAIADKKIYNVDYEGVKYWINTGCDEALTRAAEPWREIKFRKSLNNPTWGPNDPRWNVGYSVSPLHAGSFLKKLQNKKIEQEPELVKYEEVLAEVAQIGSLLVQIKPFIVKGRKPSENPVEVDLTNTGICPVCGKRQKLSFDAKMVDHGYTVPRGWGGRNGHCLGFKHSPYELSNEGNIYFKGILENQIRNREEYLQRLEKREIPEFRYTKDVYRAGRFEKETFVIKKGEKGYEEKIANEINNTQRDIEFLKEDVTRQETLIKNWTLQPLKYGGAETQERWKSRLTQK